ncbi:hypothetical protein QJS10_CPB12g00356 [Acorus calamus]|uniref:Uncharacterized protein n=1 Tax=Acorus calamus TaxID=4465 RepID=A0AAV9DJ63_ACOCL|nr:hypothetical protein QJS10_CPB12g00356 [Acorus calamus]
MVRKRFLREFCAKEAVEFFNHVVEGKPMLPFLVPLVLLAWAIERWLVPFSNWVPLIVAVWATIQHGRFQRQILVEDLNHKWRRLVLDTLPVTPLEPCEWLNKLLMEVWPNYMDPKLSKKFSSIVERRLRNGKPRMLEMIELQDFSLGSCPPTVGKNGARWLTSRDQRILRMGFDWDTNDMSIMLLVKLAKPLRGTARIVINSIHIKGDLLLTPILDGQAVLYSFESTPEVRIGVAFGGGGSQSFPATELPGVSTWLVKIFTETLVKIMVEPRRMCFSLPAVDIKKKAIGGVLSVTVLSANNLAQSTMKASNSGGRQNSIVNGSFSRNANDRELQTFVEVELGELTRSTSVGQGSSPRWDSTINMVLHGDTGILKFNLYEWIPSSVKYDYLTSCEIKLKYFEDGSTAFWAVGPKCGVLAKRAECCGREVKMVVPFEGVNSGELTVGLVLKEWQYSDDSISLSNSGSANFQHSVYGLPSFQSRTGRKIVVTVVEGRDLATKDKSGKCDPYVKVQYGKVLRKTKTISHAVNPTWNQIFEFDEVGGGQYLKLKCYNSELFGDDNIGTARVSLEGLSEDSPKDAWIPLEKVSTGELRIQIEAVPSDDYEGSKNGATTSSNGWIKVVLIEAKDLIAADLRGTSDPYVRVHYGNIKKTTKVIYKTLNPQWNQTLEFPDNGSPLALHVKDHNTVLPTSSIGDCVVDYERLPPNEMADKWIPLQGVKNGEIHVQITRVVPELQKKPSYEADVSALLDAYKISTQIRETVKNFRGLVDQGDLEGLSLALGEIEGIEEVQEEYMLQLEREKMLLLEKIRNLALEINQAPLPLRKNSG